MERRAADLIVQCLEAESVELVFGIPGEENIWLVRALARSRIRYVLVRHEQAASFMADIYGRLTGKAGVCSATLGPGAINLLLGTADAQTCSAPLVALGAQVSLDRIFKESHQAIDLVGMFKPVTKWADTVLSVNAIPEMIRKAFDLAQGSRPGAVFIAIPEDIEQALMSRDLMPLRIPRAMRPHVPDADLDDVVARIDASKRPIVLAGHGVTRAGASGHLTAFAEATDLPVATTFHAKGAIADSHPNTIGTIGFMRHDYENFSFDEADLVIAIGYELQEFDPVRINRSGRTCVIHIHDLTQDSDKRYQPEWSLVGNIASTLDRLGARVNRRAAWSEHDRRRSDREELRQGADDDAWPLKPARIVADIRKALGSDDIVLADTGAAKMWMARLYPTERPDTCLISNGLSTMAFALPGAMAAKLAFPDRKVLASMGDGAFLMNCQEIETAVRERIPLTVLIWEDRAYGLIKWKMDLELQEHEEVDFSNPNFVALAESFGAKGQRVASAAELLPALRAALVSDGVTIVVCPVDYTENLRLTKRLEALNHVV